MITPILFYFILITVIVFDYSDFIFWDYGDYASSLTRINEFLALPEKNNQLTGLIINEPIQTITFEQVFFQYRHNQTEILTNYQRTFTSGQINHLTGANGTGKSTILYLLLGITFITAHAQKLQPVEVKDKAMVRLLGSITALDKYAFQSIRAHSTSSLHILPSS